jgi:hypothetical protein
VLSAQEGRGLYKEAEGRNQDEAREGHHEAEGGKQDEAREGHHEAAYMYVSRGVELWCRE